LDENGIVDFEDLPMLGIKMGSGRLLVALTGFIAESKELTI
jgi:hypothetical protein